MKHTLYKYPVFCTLFCAVLSLHAATSFCQHSVTIIAPSHIPPGQQFPIVVYACDNDGEIADTFEGVRTLRFQSAETVQMPVSFKKGVAYVSTRLNTAALWDISVDTIQGTSVVNTGISLPERVHAGETSQAVETWAASELHVIEDTVIVPEYAELVIEQGAVIQIRNNSSVIIHGTIRVDGTEQEPVLITAQNHEESWGGIEVRNGTGDFSYCFLTGGGGDRNRVFGHSDSQPTVYAENAELRLGNCYLVYNPGKGLGSLESGITVDSSIIAHCDTGGEFKRGTTHISSSYIMDIPNDDGIVDDDDNDGLYFNGVRPGSDQPSVLEDSYIITAKDDGIDHNGARLNVTNCWIEKCDNGGIAASNTFFVDVYDTVIRSCGQGVEVGYGAPEVRVDHCVFIDNVIGLRFGDEYYHGCDGSATVENTIFHGNGDNIHNFDLKSGGPVENAITITYSLTNDVEYDDEPFCLSGIPLFDDNYHLLPLSPGVDSGMNGSDMGLVAGDGVPDVSVSDHSGENERLMQPFQLGQNFPNPFNATTTIPFVIREGCHVNVTVYSSVGQKVEAVHDRYLDPGRHAIRFDAGQYSNGVYLYTVSAGRYRQTGTMILMK
jgi:hypothetical protein